MSDVSSAPARDAGSLRSGSRVLVSGASGFVGRPLIAELARRGEQVHAISTRAEPPKVEGVHWHRVDLANDSQSREMIEEIAPERLVHLAWYVEPGRFWNASENVSWVEISLRLMRAFVAGGGRRAVMLGSCAEYDWSVADRPLDEGRSPLAPGTLYGVAKDALRRVVEAYAEQAEIELAWGRLFYLYGPGEPPGRLVSSIAASLLAGETVDTTSGRQRRDFMHVEDVAGALVALLDSSIRGPVNIASGEAVKVSDVIERLGRLTGGSRLLRPGALPERSGEPQLLVGDVARLREEVGFQPRWGLEDGLADSVAWWRQRLRIER